LDEPVERLPNSDAQRARLSAIASRGQTDHLAHCVTTALEITGPLPVDALRPALDRVVALRPALRSGFSPDAPFHEVRPAGPVPLTHRLLSGVSPAQGWEAAHEEAARESHQPFPVGTTPLLRAVALTVDPRRHLLVVSVDPLAADAWSANLLLEDLIAAAFPSAGAAASHGVDDYAAVQRRRVAWEDGPEGRAALARRTAGLDGAAHGLPRWDAVDAGGSTGATMVEHGVDLPDDVVERLRARIRRAAGSTFAAGLAAVVAASPREPARPVAVTSTFAARDPGAEERVVGWLSNDVALVLPAPRGTVGDYLRAVRGEIFAVLGDQRVPFGRLREEAAIVHEEGVSVSLLYLPGQLSGGGDRPPPRPGAATVRRAAVSVCPTGADVDLFLLEVPPPRADGARPMVRLGALSGPAHRAAAETLLGRWRDALVALADIEWNQTSMRGWRALVDAGRPVSAGVDRP
jgi:hypothetical protein